MRYSRRLNTESTDLEASFEIDLSPLLALAVTLIPVMRFLRQLYESGGH